MTAQGKVKVGDKFFWERQKNTGTVKNYVGTVIAVWENNKEWASGQAFTLVFDGRDDRGPFYTAEITNGIIRYLTPLEELL